MQSGTTKFSDLLQQDAASGRVYPLMRRYLSMYNGPVNTGALYYDLLSWDTDVSRNADTKMPVKYKWANAFAKRNKNKKEIRFMSGNVQIMKKKMQFALVKKRHICCP